MQQVSEIHPTVSHNHLVPLTELCWQYLNLRRQNMPKNPKTSNIDSININLDCVKRALSENNFFFLIFRSNKKSYKILN